jgi:hypothetical protein
LIVQLPDGIEFVDLNETPAIWRNVQSNKQKALQKFDMVQFRSADHSWAATAMVADGRHDTVILAGIKRYDLGARIDALGSDDVYREVFEQGLYTVRRISDNCDMSPNSHFHTPALATAFRLSLHPRTAA